MTWRRAVQLALRLNVSRRVRMYGVYGYRHPQLGWVYDLYVTDECPPGIVTTAVLKRDVRP